MRFARFAHHHKSAYCRAMHTLIDTSAHSSRSAKDPISKLALDASSSLPPRRTTAPPPPPPPPPLDCSRRPILSVSVVSDSVAVVANDAADTSPNEPLIQPVGSAASASTPLGGPPMRPYMAKRWAPRRAGTAAATPLEAPPAPAEPPALPPALAAALAAAEVATLVPTLAATLAATLTTTAVRAVAVAGPVSS